MVRKLHWKRGEECKKFQELSSILNSNNQWFTSSNTRSKKWLSRLTRLILREYLKATGLHTPKIRQPLSVAQNLCSTLISKCKLVAKCLIKASINNSKVKFSRWQQVACLLAQTLFTLSRHLSLLDKTVPLLTSSVPWTVYRTRDRLLVKWGTKIRSSGKKCSRLRRNSKWTSSSSNKISCNLTSSSI